ncbi:MAG: zinc ribbon domain-containing protein [Desulfomonile tiedjei]|uniref:Zinc ribbon domain-containing protein n=1 Tax=Desulfomonile tiedjei TaxID=2358 RepID=A0A9D6Z5V4_9BACT|nr:zinc ribbon domain-containing protein [Desulfomonile tiedjei]
MPIKEYLCGDCGSISELLVGIGRNSDDIACRSCGSSELQERLSAPAPPVINNNGGHVGGSTCCGGSPSSKGCVPGSCCGSS